jgi:hypothetical protein
MAFILDAAFDAALTYVQSRGTRLDICSTEPTTYTQAITTYSLGNKLTPTIAAPSDRTGGGRKITTSAITDGSVTGNGTAAFWAITQVATTTLLATGSLSATQVVTSGNTFTLASFDIGVTDAVSA